jgi:hypothetical protein
LNKRWLIIPLLALAGSSFAQTDSGYLNFIYEFIRDGQPKDTIHYASNLKPFEIKAWAHMLNKRHVIGLAWPNDYDTLSLTRQERKYIQKQLKASLDSSWPDKLFPDSKVLPADSIDRYIHRVNRAIIDSIKAQGGQLSNGFRRLWGFRFSRPIYLRNNTLLISYLKRYAQHGGEDEVKVYRREGNSWKRWILIDGAAW